jgi:bacteriocin biosynthesis cyclodehydratase domain-containing protein
VGRKPTPPRSSTSLRTGNLKLNTEYKLRLSTRTWAVPVTDGFLLGTRTEVLRLVRGGELLLRLLPDVRGALEESPASVNELCSSLAGRYPPEVVADAARKFVELGILQIVEDAGSLSGTAPTEMDGLGSYVAAHTADVSRKMEALLAGRAVLLGHGRVASTVARALREAQIGSLAHYASQAGGSSDESLAGCVPLEELGTDPAIAAACGDADLLLACADDPLERLRLFPVANEASLLHGKPLLVAYLDGDRSLLGPLFVPRETGCVRCMELREEGHLTHPEEFRAFKAYIRTERLLCSTDAAPMSARILGESVALEAVRVLSRLSFPTTYQTMVETDLRTFEHRHHSLLRVPLCDACGPQVATPLKTVWDI